MEIQQQNFGGLPLGVGTTLYIWALDASY